MTCAVTSEKAELGTAVGWGQGETNAWVAIRDWRNGRGRLDLAVYRSCWGLGGMQARGTR